MAGRVRVELSPPDPRVGATSRDVRMQSSYGGMQVLQRFRSVVPMQELPKPTPMNLSLEQVRPGTRVPKPTSYTRQPSLQGGHVVVAVNGRFVTIRHSCLGSWS